MSRTRIPGLPGGLKPTDRRWTPEQAGRCSRCAEQPLSTDRPLVLWSRCGRLFYYFCEVCLAQPKERRNAKS